MQNGGAAVIAKTRRRWLNHGKLTVAATVDDIHADA
jgi:hypothetical protein